MAKKKTRKVVDKWKSKKWYSVYAPSMFDHKEIGEIVSADENNLINRVMNVSISEVVGVRSPSAMFTNLKFRIKEVKGNGAYTSLIGHEIASSYIKTFARRRRTVLHHVLDVKTKDNKDVRLKMIAVTLAKISEVMRKNLRAKMEEEVKNLVKGLSYDQLMDEIISGRFSSKIYNKLKEITPMKRFEIRKSELKEEFK